jgi:hypothetical protein
VNPPDHIVFIVDDDRRICEAVSDLLSSFDMQAVAFGSAAEYMAYAKPDVPGCQDEGRRPPRSGEHGRETRPSCLRFDLRPKLADKA